MNKAIDTLKSTALKFTCMMAVFIDLFAPYVDVIPPTGGQCYGEGYWHCD